MENRDMASQFALGFLSMDYHLGCEINMHKAVDLYLGYDVENFTGGLSINHRNWKINYSFEQNSDLENSHRVSVGYKI
jgi:hypothetical protein